MRWSIPVLLLVLLSAACERRPGFLRQQTPHEVYGESLRKAGLEGTALGRDWLAAADAALREPKGSQLPLDSTLSFTAGEARAFGFRFELKRGRVLRAQVTPEGRTDTLVFVDLFRLADQPGDPPRPVASASRGERTIEHEIGRDGAYVLRIQPELLRGGTLRITQRTMAALGFPVAGRGSAAVQSFFRDPRDGGRRQHHGVDIFAPRDTPVLAAAPGIVSSVSTTPLGGNVVWIWDGGRRQSHYYAHLSRQAVRTGDRVQAGDVIGYVGNTGNARSTPPHLHFGIYAVGDGPIDPLPFVQGAPLQSLRSADTE